MASKTLKVSEVVYDRLEAQKGTDETFDDVLRAKLGLKPDVEDAAAYLPDRKREIALDLIEVIDRLAEFEHTIETDGAHAHYHFVSPSSGLTIVRADFEESANGSSMGLRYRGMDGNMKFLTSLNSDDEVDLEWGLDLEDEYDELTDNITEVVEGAIRKWH